MSQRMTRDHQSRPRRSLRVTLATAIIAAAVGSMMVGTSAASATKDLRSAAPALSTASPCEALESLNLNETVAISADLVTSGQAEGQSGLPEFCRVKLTVSEAINIEVWLPTSTYNGRLQAVGGWGYAGNILYFSMADALRQGYATTATDGGHVGIPYRGTFALNPNGTLNHQLIEDYASRSLVEMTLKAKEVIAAFYGKAAEYSYWNGCSNGGRQGMVLAQRLPDAYDGMMIGAPAMMYARLFTASLWPFVVQQNELGDPMSACKLKAFNDAAIAHCDAYDGVVDGVLGDPKLCDFDPATLVGKDFGCGEITAAEAATVRKIWNGPVAPDGEQLWNGIAPGTSLEVYALEPSPLLTDFVAYWIKQDPTFDWHSLDYAEYAQVFREAVAKFADVDGSDDPDLRPFQEAGGKIVMWAGQADSPIAGQTEGYYDRVVDVFHSRTQVQKFARLFMAPGVGHCGGGTGPNIFDPFGAVVNWVEKGIAPESLLASSIIGGQVVRAQPLCPYPQVAKYTGRGDINEASSYDCRANYGSSSAPGKRN